MSDSPALIDAMPPATKPRCLVWADRVPGFGWRLLDDASAPEEPARATDDGLTNGLVTIAMRPGWFALNGIERYGRLVDGGDAGDTYNYSPPADDREIDQPVYSRWSVVEHGPLRATLDWTRVFIWPSHLEGGSRTGEREVEVHTSLEVWADEPAVRMSVTFDNGCRDHRLRAWFPLPEPSPRSRAESAFAVVERGLDAEGGAHERGLPTFPFRRFVQAGGLTIVHEAVGEYELVAIEDGLAHAIALTLVRCTGILSQPTMTYRPSSAGPPIPTEGSQMQGPRRMQSAICVDPTVDPYALADDVLVPLRASRGAGGGPLGDSGTALQVRGAEVSALCRVPGGLSLRVFNPTDRAAHFDVVGRGEGEEVDLRGRRIARFSGERDMRPWEIVTVVLPD